MIYTAVRENQNTLPFLVGSRQPVVNTDTSNLAELAVYKKIPASPFIGFEHARRYFSKRNGCPLTESELIEKLGDNEIVVCKYDMHRPLKQWIHPSTLFFVKRLCKLYPEYQQTADEVLNDSIMYPHNMFFTRGENFNKYRKWLFSVIGCDVYVSDDVKAKSHYGETLLTIFCKHNFKHKIVKCNVTAWSHDLSHIVDTVHGLGDE